MTTTWQRFAVQLKGEDDPVDVQTNARDWAVQKVDPERPIDAMFRVVHTALLRLGHAVPRDYDGFLEVLDGMPETADAGDQYVTDPTNAAPSDDSP